MLSLSNVKEIFSYLGKNISKYPTDAIFVFGSYGTEFFDKESSDIDVAWFTSKEVFIDYIEYLQIELSKHLGVQVNIVDGFRLNDKLLVEVLKGNLITENVSERFSDFLDDFYDRIYLDCLDDEKLSYYYDEDWGVVIE